MLPHLKRKSFDWQTKSGWGETKKKTLERKREVRLKGKVPVLTERWEKGESAFCSPYQCLTDTDCGQTFLFAFLSFYMPGIMSCADSQIGNDCWEAIKLKPGVCSFCEFIFQKKNIEGRQCDSCFVPYLIAKKHSGAMFLNLERLISWIWKYRDLKLWFLVDFPKLWKLSKSFNLSQWLYKNRNA